MVDQYCISNLRWNLARSCRIILWVFRGKNVASANWSLLALSIVLVTVGDIGFGYSAVIDKAGKEEWIWDLFYNSSYLVMDGTSFCKAGYLPKGRLRS